MFLIAPWIIPAATAALGAFGAERKNRVDQREAAKNRAFQAQQAQDQMAFQERMRNTQWQAGIADMEAAGLNPALAYSQGPAAAPGGASGGGSAATNAMDPVSSAREAMMMREQLKQTKELTRKTQAEAHTAVSQERVARSTANTLLNIEGDSEQLLRRKLRAEIEGMEQGVHSARALQKFNDAKTRIAEPMADLADVMGPFLPILGGLGAAAGPAAKLLRRGGRNLDLGDVIETVTHKNKSGTTRSRRTRLPIREQNRR